MDSCQLYVCFRRIGDNKAVYNTLRNSFRHGMSKVALDLHGCCFNLIDVQSTDDIVKDRRAKLLQRNWRRTNDICRPAVNEFVQLRCRILRKIS